MINRILDFFFPPKCAFCGKLLGEKAPICKECMKTLPFTNGKACRICGRPLEEFSYSICSGCHSEKRYFEHSFVPLVYKDAAKKAAVRLKFYSHPYYAKALAYLLADKILSSPYYTEFDYITCVPQNSSTGFERGYNQSELIAKELSKLLKIPFIHTLRRSNAGVKQSTLNAAERKKNVKLCYFKGKGKFSGSALLTDDIYTTGATANYCAKLLREMGFDKVYLAVSMIRCSDD